MFLVDFYNAVLPDRIERECNRRPSHVPVVQFRVADGTVLDKLGFDTAKSRDAAESEPAEK